MKISYSVKTILRTDKLKSDGTCPLYYQIILNSKLLRLPVGISLKENQWDFKKNCPNKNYRGKVELSEKLERDCSDFRKFIINSKISNRNLTKNDIKNFYNGTDKKTFYDYLDEVLRKKFLKIKEGTQNHYLLLKRQLLEYNSGLMLEDINYKFITDFFYWLEVEKKVGSSGRATRRKNLIAVLEEMIKLNLLNDNPCKKIEKPKENRVEVFLTKFEIQHIKSLSLDFGKKNNGLEITRDLFLFSCYTGLRYGDVRQLSKKNIEGERIILVTEKTETKVEIPLLEEAKEILKKYNYRKSGDFIFPYRSNVTLNRDLKFLAKETGIEKRITFHIGRHTFGSILNLNKISPFMIMKFMGHSDVRMTSRYVNSNSNILRETMLGVSFS